MTNQPIDMTPDQVLLQMVTGKWVSKSISVAADLGIADLLISGPKEVEELAEETGSNTEALYRLMRLLAGLGIFSEQDYRCFSLTPLSEYLRSDKEGSVKAMASWLGEESTWVAWAQLGYSVKTGKPAFDHAFGKPFFEYCADHPKTAEFFQEAMSGFSYMTGCAVTESYDFGDIGHIVDIGGGRGMLLSLILKKFPHLTATLFDLPEVIETSGPTLEHMGEKDRIRTLSGNFFQTVPGGGDAYIMKHIIHDWNDDACIGILSQCRDVMNPGGRILVIDQVVSDAPEALLSKIVDMEMLAMTPGGKERTASEFSILFEKAGLKLSRILPTQSPVAVIEGVVP